MLPYKTQLFDHCLFLLDHHVCFDCFGTYCIIRLLLRLSMDEGRKQGKKTWQCSRCPVTCDTIQWAIEDVREWGKESVIEMLRHLFKTNKSQTKQEFVWRNNCVDILLRASWWLSQLTRSWSASCRRSTALPPFPTSTRWRNRRRNRSRLASSWIHRWRWEGRFRR